MSSSNRHRPSFAIPVTPKWQPLLVYLDSMENHHARSEWLRNAAWARMLLDIGLVTTGISAMEAPPPAAAVSPAKEPLVSSSKRHRPSFAIPVTPEWRPLIVYLDSMENHHARSEWLRNAAWWRMMQDRSLVAMGAPAMDVSPPIAIGPPVIAETPAPIQPPRVAVTKPVSVPIASASAPGNAVRTSTTPRPAMPPETVPTAMEAGGVRVEGLSPEALRGLRKLVGG